MKISSQRIELPPYEFDSLGPAPTTLEYQGYFLSKRPRPKEDGLTVGVVVAP